MAAMDEAVKQYNLSFFQKFMDKTGNKIKFLRDKYEGSHLYNIKELNQKKMHETYLINVKNGGLPDEINWLNIKYSSRNRQIRKAIIWLIAIILILIGFASMVTLKSYVNGLKEEIQTESSSCPATVIDLKNNYMQTYKVKDVPQTMLDLYVKKQAYERFTKNEDTSVLNCYCSKIHVESGATGVLKVNFKDVANDDSNLCSNWLIR